MSDMGSIGGASSRGWDHFQADDDDETEDPISTALEAKDHPALQKAFQEAFEAGEDLLSKVDNALSLASSKEIKEFGIKSLGDFLEKSLSVNLLETFAEAFHAADSTKMQALLQHEEKLPLDPEMLVNLAIPKKEHHKALEFFKEQKQLFGLVQCLQDENVEGVVKQLKKKKQPVELLEKAIEQLSDPRFANRLLSYVKVMIDLPGEKEHLSVIESLKIASFVEKKLEESPAEEVEYVAKRDEGLSRTLIVPFQEHSFILLSKKAGELQEFGAEKKASDAFKITISDSSTEVIRYVRLVNIADDEVSEEEAEEIVEKMQKEMTLSSRFNDDVHLIVAHTNAEGKAKLTVIVEAYDKPLSAYLRFSQRGADSRLSTEQAKEVLNGIGTKLATIHAAGFVHYDLKGANLMLKFLPDGRLQVKIIDFGKSFDGKEFQKPDENGYGSAAYSAPESFDQKTKLKDAFAQGKAEDMYALGCMLYGMIYGEEVPWASLVQRAIDTPSKEANNAAHDRQLKAYEKLQKEPPVDPFVRKLYDICLALVQPDPAQRMTLDGYMQAIATL